MPGSKATNPIMLARQGFVAWDPLKYENAAIFEENQRIRIFLELRELRSNKAIRRHQLEFFSVFSSNIAAISRLPWRPS